MKGSCGCTGSKLAWWLIIIGALNWGLVGAFDWNLVNWLVGQWEWLERAVYIIVGLAALGSLWGCKCKTCKKSCK